MASSSTDVGYLRALSVYSRSAFALALIAALCALASGPGTRFGWWGFRAGFETLRWAATAGGMAAVLCAVGVLWGLKAAQGRGVALCVMGLFIGLLTFGLPLPWLHGRDHLPAIHDISTDTQDPPRFVALAPVRASAPNGAQYGGPAVAAQQRAAYPDIVPMSLAVDPKEAMAECLRVAKSMGWDIAPGQPSGLTLEASDSTLFFGTRSDIVVRVTPVGTVSRVDVRSVSRTGRGDLGVNAGRIRDFYRLLARLQP
ncbi:MAG TPA: DUF1499 domain-containing protein [Burkholderiales bacterium]|nr:DUF1499 domain-containing protein [Burkholderiales bacterium]